MKTNKVKWLSAWYGFVFYILPFLFAILVIFINLQWLSLLSLICSFLGLGLVFWGIKSVSIKIKDRIQTILLLGFKEHLQAKVPNRSGEWKTFPSKDMIAEWCVGFLSSLLEFPLAQSIWITNFHANHKNSGQWRDVLKEIYLPFYNYSEMGVSLYDIEVCEEINPSDVGTKLQEVTLEQKKVLSFLKHLPLEDLLKYIQKSVCSCFNEKALGILSLREGDKQTFEYFLEMIYSKKVNVCLTDDAISFLMTYGTTIGKREKTHLSVAKPLLRKIVLFLAHYVGTKNKSMKESERKLIFDWILNQQAKHFVSEITFLLSNWPIFSVEESKIIKETFREGDSMLIFANKEMWEQVPDYYLKQIFVEFSQENPVYSWIKGIQNEKKFLKEIATRL